MIKAKKYSKLSQIERRTLRLEYIKEQENLCYWCKADLDKNPPEFITIKKLDLSLFPNGFLENKIHLQHDHITDLTEGAVHAYCNAVMWQYHNR